MNNMYPNRLPTIDGETLMSKPLQPLNFVVDTLISQGLHILAGSPKVGKSWLALWLAVTVVKGEAVWGTDVKRGTTLYLCLEDSHLRIQNRLFDVTEDAPPRVHFCTESRILSDGLEEQLRQFLVEHPDTVLVIIDTLQMIRGTTYDNTYANDYRDLSALKRLTDAHSIAILQKRPVGADAYPLRKTWRRCSSTGRPQASAPRRWSRTRAGWESWPPGGSRWRLTWSVTMSGSSPRRSPGRTASSAAGETLKKMAMGQKFSGGQEYNFEQTL